MKGLIAVAAVALILSAGCLAPSDGKKGLEAPNDIDWETKHFTTRCDFEVETGDGLHATLKDCSSGTLQDGVVNGVEIDWTGTQHAGGLGYNDRKATVTTTVYYPGPVGNSVPESKQYSADSGDAFTMQAAIKVGLEPGAGDYKVCFSIGGQNEVNNWKFGYQYKSDPTEPDPTCKTFGIKKEGFL